MSGDFSLSGIVMANVVREEYFLPNDEVSCLGGEAVQTDTE
jgi:hypothetical protein